MKKTIVAFLTIFSLSQNIKAENLDLKIASQALPSTFTAEGTVVLKHSASIVCLAIGCPPSLPLLTAELQTIENGQLKYYPLFLQTQPGDINPFSKIDTEFGFQIKAGDQLKVTFSKLNKFFNQVESIELLQNEAVELIPIISKTTTSIFNNHLVYQISLLNNTDIVVNNGIRSLTVKNQLTQTELSKLKSLLKFARQGQLVDPHPTGIRCKAVPYQQDEISGFNGLIPLKVRAYPCGDVLLNNSKVTNQILELIEARFDQAVKFFETN